MGLIADLIKSQKAADEFEACGRLVRRHFHALEMQHNVDLLRIAKDKKIAVEYRDNIPYEGMIERDSSGAASIVLRKGLTRRRERFTLAHELGHWLLQEEMIGTTTGRLFRGVSKNSKEMAEEERLASLLAAEVLMPFHPILLRFDENNKIRSLQSICREFGVSRIAAVRRIADVCGKNLFFLQVVPFIFSNLKSVAEVDDAIFASSRQGTLFDRDFTRFVSKISFEFFAHESRGCLELNTPKGRISGEFEIDYRPRPIPHASCLILCSEWPNEVREPRPQKGISESDISIPGVESESPQLF